MIDPACLQFLKKLAKNNSKAWFDLHREEYLFAKENFIDFATKLLQGLIKIDPTLAELNVRKCVFRINRDIRFSKNKDPYKTNFGVFFTPNGKADLKAGYYFHLEPGAHFIAAGLYMPMPEQLRQLRQEIDYCFDDFKKIIFNKKFINRFGALNAEQALVRPPKGYDDLNPAIDFLKLKSFTCSKPLTDKAILDKDLLKDCLTDFKIVHPFVQFINHALD